MFEFTRSLFTLPGFYDQCGEYVRYSAQDDPGLQDMLDAYCDSAGTVVMHLLKEDQNQSQIIRIKEIVRIGRMGALFLVVQLIKDICGLLRL